MIEKEKLSFIYQTSEKTGVPAAALVSLLPAALPLAAMLWRCRWKQSLDPDSSVVVNEGEDLPPVGPVAWPEDQQSGPVNHKVQAWDGVFIGGLQAGQNMWLQVKACEEYTVMDMRIHHL